ncbi:disease resistance protein RUN1 isoform X3 [Vitis vinifera]|nr:disease resistance protein RUN1 isoform X3 [Vitis vinifera]
MASTSAQMASDSSPFDLRWTHDVFLSFRGEDTRYDFTDHLYNALVGKGIITFRDEKLKRGEKIAPKLLNAIEKSRSSIVVFSKTYADSRWCLDELAKIIECSRKYRQIVFPIFYHVDPSDVRKQTGRFGEAFTKYEENWKNKVQSWREALTEAGNLSGWHVNEGYESEHIKKITTTIANRILNCKPLFVGDNLVGMDSHFKKISLGLHMESNDVHMVGICGIGGIGKTTIARYIYNQISQGFECNSFLEDAKKVYKKKGLARLQKLLLNDIQKGENSKISNIQQGAQVIQNSLYHRKALIVLDDVDDDMDNLDFLVGNHAWYGEGSRIIITTRDKRCLTMLNVNYVYNVEGLDSNEAFELFSRHAFRSNLPKEDFRIFLNPVINYCEGLPLALKVLGSLLCGKTKGEWTSELHKLEKEPEMKIHNVLKISFDGLDTTQQMILLDIACFFQGEDKDFASKIWDGYELYGEINIGVLLERCLITISYNRLRMHGLIEKMCKKIVREQHGKDTSKWSRLWNPDDIYYAFVSEEGMENVETISLDLSRSKEKWFNTKIVAQMKKVFPKMKNLRLLKVYYSLGDAHEMSLPKDFEFPPNLNYLHWEDLVSSLLKVYYSLGDAHEMSLPKDFEFPPNLNYLHWEGLVSLPSNFHGEKLVAINLKSSNIKELLKGEKCLAELKFIDLSNSQQLIKIPKFSRMPKLEKLNLEGCVSFSRLHSSIGHVPRLGSLNLGKCKNLRSVPTSILQLESLRVCSLSHCSNLEIFPEIMEDMEHSKGLSLRESAITELPSSIRLDLSNCENLETLLNSIGMTYVSHLVVRNCPKLHKLPDSLRSMQLKQLDVSCCNLMAGAIPDDLWCLFSLVELNVSGNNIDCIPGGIIRLSRLHTLIMNHCLMLKEIPELPSSLRRIEAYGCPLLETLSSDAKHPLWSSLPNCLKSHIQDIDLPKKSDWMRNRVHVIIPGSRGIPEWISHKSMRDEITIDLPKNWYEDNNFLGFALFSHYPPVDDDRVSSDGLRLLISDGDQFGHVETINFIPYWSLDMNSLRLPFADPALMVVYFPQIAISSEYRSNRWNKFKTRFSALPFPYRVYNAAFKVKSCGIHLIYDHGQDHPQQSLQLFNVKRSHDDTEDHPHV